MDLNQLLYHHQIALMNASRPADASSDAIYFDLARHYVRRIQRYRAENGLSGRL
ncbi:hypothetical protein [Alteraurantiacibacter aquimixticola]|uniref:hypothetical protein n=1 Tax=Alteraurantiacibacter aquimixticola TaxID=2489173 RepID=UPI00145C1568|nr:hypothetical protein [Alteraurantiacibacter aquimixticola]